MLEAGEARRGGGRGERDVERDRHSVQPSGQDADGRAAPRRLDLRSHGPQRLCDTFHGPAPERRVAVEQADEERARASQERFKVVPKAPEDARTITFGSDDRREGLDVIPWLLGMIFK